MLRRLLNRLLFSVAFTVCAGNAFPAGVTPWLPFGPDGGDARRIAGDPQDHAHLFLGAANGWIYESKNAGANWKRLAQVGKLDDLVLDSIVIDPANSKHIIVGAWTIDHSDGGIFISNDAGHTWFNQAEMRGQSVRALAISLSNPKVLVAGSLQGVFMSSDMGQRWKRISPRDSTEIHEVESVAIDPVDANIIYAGTWHLPWKTTDGGEHWDNIKDGIIDDSDVFSIIVDPKSPKTVFASACSGIYKSENAGELFHKVQGIPATSRRTRVLLQDPNQREIVFAGTTEGLFRSEDSGKTWVAKTGPEIIVNDVLVDSADSHHVLIATDRGGVLSSEDGADTFHPSNGGFSARQITAMKRDAGHPAVLYVGVVNDKEWGGVFRSDNGGLGWSQISQGLQGRDIFSLGQAPDGTMIAGTSHGIFRLSEDKVWERVDAAEEAPTGATAEAHMSPVSMRPPVPIGRNHFAERQAPKKLTGMQRKSLASAAAARKRTPAGSPALRKAKLHAASKKTKPARQAVKTIRVVTPRAVMPRPLVPEVAVIARASRTSAVKKGFDGNVFSLVTLGDSLLAATSEGMLRSDDNGLQWTPFPSSGSTIWTQLAAAKTNVVAASRDSVEFSSDSGVIWVPVRLPESLTRVNAIAVEPSGAIWVGGPEGVFVTGDAGNSWVTPKNLYVTSVSSLFYDEASNRILLTTQDGSGSYNGLVFTVQLPERQVRYVDTGWALRFARPVGDHLVAVTPYDGIVVQPKMMASPIVNAPAGVR